MSASFALLELDRNFPLVTAEARKAVSEAEKDLAIMRCLRDVSPFLPSQNDTSDAK